MSMVIETDIGRDPDDFFALLYLIGAGEDIRAISVTPGDRDQIAVVKFVLSELGLSIPVGSARPDRQKSSAGGIHTTLLQRYGYPATQEPDGSGLEVLQSAFSYMPGIDLFACGPLQATGDFLRAGGKINNVLMQGGFIGYDVHGLPCKRLDKFEGLTHCPTFNLNGDVKAAQLLLECPCRRAFVGKNVCHAIFYDREVNARILPQLPKCRAAELFAEGMTLHFETHDGKMFHDPAAAAIYRHPEIATWVTGTLYRKSGGWGTELSEFGSQIAVDIDHEMLWDVIANFR